MGLFQNEYSKTAVVIGKVKLLMDEYQSKSWEYQFKESYELAMLLAYISRVGILDRLEKNNWNPTAKISIPTGMFTQYSTTLREALFSTVYKLQTVFMFCQSDIQNVFDKGEKYIEMKREISQEQLNKLINK